MMKFYLLFSACLLIFLGSYSQGARIQGILKDTIQQKTPVNSVAALIRSKDSILIKHARTDAQGKFQFRNVDTGEYLLMITHPRMTTFIEPLSVKDTALIDMGDISLLPESVMLSEVIIRGSGAIRVKGDTTEFVADSFKLAANATVEDLLKKLPGLQVNRKGEITAQGERVQKVLVDGEEFFNDDPAMVIKGLNADMVEKVQVFDKKSDQAEFTGVDDGIKNKTINLKLKEDKKNGYFGKVNAGAGTQERYNTEGMINAFKGKQKVSAYGVASNTGRTGLGWNDSRSFGGDDNTVTEFDASSGSMMITSYGDEFGGGGQYNGEGLPESWTIGGQYTNKWNDNKRNANLGYKFNHLNAEAEYRIESQYILPDTLYYVNTKNKSITENNRHSLSGYFDITIDSLSSIKISASGKKMNYIRNQAFESESLNEVQQFVNTNNRILTADGETNQLNATLFYRKKFRKMGRNFSLSGKMGNMQTEDEGYLLSLNQFYDNTGNVFKRDSIDQLKTRDITNQTWEGKATYMEPLNKKTFLEVNYQIQWSGGKSTNSSYDKQNGKYDEFNPLFSNIYDLKVLSNSGGAFISYNEKKWTARFGSNLGVSDFKQENLLADTGSQYRFNIYSPNAMIAWKIRTQTHLRFTYRGNTRVPTMNQLEPLLINTDPLNIYTGNPSLKPSFIHSFNLNYNDFKVLKSRYQYASFTYTITENAISNNEFIDTLGRRIYQYENVDGVESGSLWSGMNWNLKDNSININTGVYGGWNRYVNTINRSRNVTKSRNIGINTGIYYNKENKFEMGLSADASYVYSTSSIREDVVTDYWSFGVQPEITYHLTKKWDVGTDAEMNFRQKTTVFDRNNNVIRWNAFTSYKLLKEKNLELRASVKDILDQNIGFSRNVNSNYIEEKTFNTLRRYFLFSVIWNFHKKGMPAPTNEF